MKCKKCKKCRYEPTEHEHLVLKYRNVGRCIVCGKTRFDSNMKDSLNTSNKNKEENK